MKTTFISACCVLCLLWFAPAHAHTHGVSFHVAVTGDDRNPGTESRPLATLDGARAAVRMQRSKGLPAGGITVIVHDGLYLLDHGFNLATEDSGEPGKPIVYRAASGEHPRLFGGVRLDPASFHPIKDKATLAQLTPEAQAHVVQLQLPANIHGPARYPEVFKGNGGMVQLLVDDQIMPLSRWPNAGYTTMANVVDSGMVPKPHGGTFHYREEVAAHAAAWATAAAQGQLWLTGFWRVPFEVYSMRVASLDPAAHTITFISPGIGSPPLAGIGSKYSDTVNGTRIGNGKEQYYVVNLLSEIDRPGEWSFDFNDRTLSFWPTSASLASHEILLANVSLPVVSVQAAHDITLEGLTLEGGLAEAITIRSGDRIVVAGNTLRNTGGGGVDIEGGANDVVQSNELTNLGSFGVRAVAGDRVSLTPAHILVENNHIHHFGTQERITQGIYLGGVGNRAVHNLIHDGPYHGIEFAGNDQYMAYNEIHHIGLDAGDMGVFYTNGDWAGQGDIIEYNFGHHSPNANGAYLDDGASSRIVRYNIFDKLSSGLFLGGGHDNVFENNLILDCKTAIHIDNRGVARHYDANAHHLTNFLKTIDPASPPWSVRYPGFLHNILADPTQPTGNVVVFNAIVGAATPYQISTPAVVDPRSNPVLAAPLPFIDAASLNFALPASNPLITAIPQFKALSMDGIGLQLDRYRKTLPTAEETGRFTARESMQTFDSNIDVKASDKMGAPKPKPQP